MARSAPLLTEAQWKNIAPLLSKVRHRGTLNVDWMFTFACAAYNLVRMRNLMSAAFPAQ